MRSLKFSNQAGQSLLEIIVALGIFALIGSVMAPFIVGSFVGLERGGEQTQAEALAQEGIEAVRSIRDGAWNEILYNQSAAIVSSGQWVLAGEGTTEQIGQFTRTITFDNVCRDISDEIVSCPGDYTDVHSKKITVTVDWDPTIGITNSVRQAAYLTNWDSQEWVQTDWSGGSGQSIWFNQTKYLTDDNNIDVSTAGEAKLETIGISLYGSSFVIDSFSGVGRMKKEEYRTSLRFKAQNSKTVNAIRVYLNHEKNSPTYRYGLQSDDSGEPSNIWLGDNNQAYGDHQATNTGWQIINLNEQVTLTTDTTYHLVVQHQSGYTGGHHTIELRQSDPNNFMHPYDGSPNSSSNVLWSENEGENWSVQEHQPIYVLDFSDNTHEGNPYHETTVYKIYGTACFGEQFTITDTDQLLSEISFFVSEGNQGPEDNLYVAIYDITTGEDLLDYGVITTCEEVTNTEYIWVTYSFSSPLVLITGNTYRAYVSSPLSESTAYYFVKSMHHDNIADLNEINYDGINSYLVTSNDGGDIWDTTNPNYDVNGFYLSKSIYQTSGELISSAFDMGGPSKSQIIEWDEAIPSCDPDCTIKIQIQTALESSGEWSNWCGPEGKDEDETDYFTNSNGELIHTANNGNQWIRYKAILIGDSSDTPILEEVRINYK